MGILVTFVTDSGTDTVHKVAEVTELPSEAADILEAFGLKLGIINGLSGYFVGFHLTRFYNAIQVDRAAFIGRCHAVATVHPSEVYLWLAEMLVACSDHSGATVVVTR